MNVHELTASYALACLGGAAPAALLIYAASLARKDLGSHHEPRRAAIAARSVACSISGCGAKYKDACRTPGQRRDALGCHAHWRVDGCAVRVLAAIARSLGRFAGGTGCHCIDIGLGVAE